MLNINYDGNNYSDFIRDFMAQMEVSSGRNVADVPSQIGNGYLQGLALANGLTCLIVNFTTSNEIFINQKRSEEEIFALRFNGSVPVENPMVKIDKKYLWQAPQPGAYVVLTSSLFDFAYRVPKGSVIKGIDVLIPAQWLLNHIPLVDAGAVLEKYLVLKNSSYNFEPFDDEYNALFTDIMRTGSGTGFYQEGMEDKLMLLVKRYISELIPKLHFLSEKEKIKISGNELLRLMQVEAFLTKDYSKPPPSIFALSKLAAMSTTSLKIKFKKMYGTSIYEYFQKSRMKRAKVLMLSDKYSIKQVGGQLGYSNLGNFSIAFKKEFRHLPSNYLLSRKY